MTQWEKIVELLEELVNINAGISNQQLDLLDKLEYIRRNTLNTSNNTYERSDTKDHETNFHNRFKEAGKDTRTIKFG